MQNGLYRSQALGNPAANNDTYRTTGGCSNIFGNILCDGMESVSTSFGTNRAINSSALYNTGNKYYDDDSSNNNNDTSFCVSSIPRPTPSRKRNCNDYSNYNEGCGTATNLITRNNGIAFQSNLIDEVLAEKQRERLNRMQDLFNTNSFSSNPISNKNNNHNHIDHSDEASLSDEVITDLSRRLNSVSLAEKQDAQDDMYGFRIRPKEEDPLKLDAWLNEMDGLIDRGINGNDKRFSALRLAMHSNSPCEESSGMGTGHAHESSPNNNDEMEMTGAQYVRSQRLKFLRACAWVVEKAVIRLAKFFELKLEYFGPDFVARDLTLEDLTKEELELWRQRGFIQAAQERDAYGRAIFVFSGKMQHNLPVRVVCRVFLYFAEVNARDERTQIIGSDLIYIAHAQEAVVPNRAKFIFEILTTWPVRIVASHVLYENSKAKVLLLALAKFVGLFGVIRLRLHQGTVMECVYNLMTYGIPRNAIQVNNDGETRVEFHQAYLDDRWYKETEDKNRRRRERLDRQLQQQKGNNRHRQSNTQQQQDSGTRQPYQREPPLLDLDRSIGSILWSEGLEDDFLAPISRNPAMHIPPQPCTDHGLEDLEDDFLAPISRNPTTMNHSREKDGLEDLKDDFLAPIMGNPTTMNHSRENDVISLHVPPQPSTNHGLEDVKGDFLAPIMGNPTTMNHSRENDVISLHVPPQPSTNHGLEDVKGDFLAPIMGNPTTMNHSRENDVISLHVPPQPSTNHGLEDVKGDFLAPIMGNLTTMNHSRENDVISLHVPPQPSTNHGLEDVKGDFLAPIMGNPTTMNHSRENDVISLHVSPQPSTNHGLEDVKGDFLAPIMGNLTTMNHSRENDVISLHVPPQPSTNHGLEDVKGDFLAPIMGNPTTMNHSRENEPSTNHGLEDVKGDFLAPIMGNPTTMNHSRENYVISLHVPPQPGTDPLLSTPAVHQTRDAPLLVPSLTPAAADPEPGSKLNDVIGVPGVLDIIMGRGRHNKQNPGNRKLNQLLEHYLEQYEAADKFHKTVLSEVVVSKMIEGGSRFLARDREKKEGKGPWVEVSFEKARDKVAHDFRNLRRNANLAKNQSNPGGATDGSNPETDGTTTATASKRRRSINHRDNDGLVLL
eukprot:jgi/Psemu1/282160/fgenesh1_pg.3_\